jgi:hypothetical protein
MRELLFAHPLEAKKKLPQTRAVSSSKQECAAAKRLKARIHPVQVDIPGFRVFCHDLGKPLIYEYLDEAHW